MVDITHAQPAIKPGIGKSIVHMLVEGNGRLMCQKRHRRDKATFQRERAAVSNVKDIDNRNAARFTARNQSGNGLLEGRKILLLPVFTMKERLLCVDIDKGGT
jgi:hypothetical protein